MKLNSNSQQLHLLHILFKRDYFTVISRIRNNWFSYILLKITRVEKRTLFEKRILFKKHTLFIN